MRHLVAYGHQRIAFLGDIQELWTVAERYLGYVAGPALAGLRLAPKLVRPNVHSAETAEQAVLELLGYEEPLLPYSLPRT